MMIITDAAAHPVAGGTGGVLRRADRVGLIEGTRWSEDVIGTNAMGTRSPRTPRCRSTPPSTWYALTTPDLRASPVHDPDTGGWSVWLT